MKGFILLLVVVFGQSVMAAVGNAALPAGKTLQWSVNGFDIRIYRGKTLQIIQKVFGKPDATEGNFHIYRGLHICDAKSGEIYNIVKFLITDEVVKSVQVESGGKGGGAKALEAAIRKNLNKPEGELTKADFEELRGLLIRANERIKQLQAQVNAANKPKGGQVADLSKQLGIKRKYDGVYEKIEPDLYNRMATKVFKGKSKEEVVAALGEPHSVGGDGNFFFYRVEYEGKFSGKKYHRITVSFNRAGVRSVLFSVWLNEYTIE